MSLDVRDPRFAELFEPGAALQTLSTGHLFTEGPLWDAKANRLLFSDIPGDRIHAWSEAGGTSVFRAPSHKSNGLAWDRQGRLLACEHVTSRLTRTEPDGRITVLATHWQGTALNSPNDVVAARDGSIWFSDPTYGRMPHYGLERPVELGHRGVYRLAPDGTTLSLVADDFRQPNGLCFSLDEQRLFVNDTERGHVRVFDVGADGSVSGGAVWAEPSGDGPGAPDGMKIDSAGQLWCCGPGGLHVYDAGAHCLGVLRTPVVAANFTWGDADRRSLYITASDTVLRVRVRVPGCPAPDA